MKRMMTLCCAALIALVTPTTWAADEHQAHHPDGTTQQPVATGDSAVTKPVIDEQLRKMQTARDKAANAKTPDERQMAMMEQMQVMQESMAMMKSMEAQMMGDGMKDCPVAGKSKVRSNAAMTQHKQMMDMMMQMMGQQRSMMSMPMGQ